MPASLSAAVDRPFSQTISSASAKSGWIWCRDGADENIWVWARHEFSAPRHAGGTLEITADSRYMVWINGRTVGFGPPKYHPETPTFDRYDISGFLEEGRNVIAVQVYSLGFRPISSFAPRGGALYVRFLVDGQVWESDETWRMTPDPSYCRETLPRWDVQPPAECYDARRCLGDPRHASFRDQAWPHACVRDFSHVKLMEPRDIPVMATDWFRPDRIISRGLLKFSRSVRDIPFLDSPAFMADAEYHPDRHGAIEPDGATGGLTVTPPSETEGCYIIWDLGRIWTGYPRLTVSGSPGTVIDLCYGEHLTDGVVNAAKSRLNYVDRIILGNGILSHRITWPKCARYVQINVLQGYANLHLLEWERSTYPVERKGHFFSSDPVLDQAVEISLHTVQLCMEDSYMDSPWRERGSWLGDDLSKCQVAYGYFGDYVLARRFLVHHARGQLASGMMRGKYPGNVTSHVSTWTLRFPASVLEYCAESGDWNLAEELWPNLERLRAWILARQRADGLFAAPPIEVSSTRNFYNFIDWAPIDTRGANAAWNAFAHDGFRAIGIIARRIGRLFPEDEDILAEHRRNFAQRFWDSEKGVFFNGVVDGKRTERWGCHENVLASLFDLADSEQKARLWPKLLAEDLSARFLPDEKDYDIEVPEAGKIVTIALARNTYRWSADRMVPIGTPYFAGYLLKAMSREGLLAPAMSLIKSWWGEFSRQGATTVWETWDSRQSLSHGWSCSPALVALRQYAGLDRLDEHGETFGVFPNVKPSESFRARAWTRAGYVQALWKNSVLRLDLPRGLDYSVGLPASAGGVLVCNGRSAVDAVLVRRNGVLFASVALPAGTHDLQMIYEN